MAWSIIYNYQIILLGEQKMEYKNLLKRIGSNIKKYRELKGMTQEALAAKAGLAVRHIQKIEAGTVNLTMMTLGKISSALNVHPSDLLK